jgi:hypothetical protein
VSLAELLVLGVVVVPIALLLSWGVVRLRRGQSEIRAAIERDGFEIVRMEHRVFRQGPMFWTTTRSQSVYRVVARDASGRERTAWARWGRPWLFARDALELQWDQ